MADNAPFPNAHTYEGTVYGGVYKPEILDRVKSFKFNSDDTLLAAYPKSGRLWLEEAVWLVQNDADFEEAAKTNVRARIMPIEIKAPNMDACIDKLEKMPAPRTMSTFLYHKFYKEELEKAKPKVIVIQRNPKDVMVSYYHFYKMCAVMGYYKGSWEDFMKVAKAKQLNLGDWFDHVLGWWNDNKDKDNFLFLKYEDMVSNGREQIKKISEFLGKNHPDDVIDKIADHCTFEKMKANPMVNMENIPAYDHKISPFLRKGKVGDWKNFFSSEEAEKFDQQYKKMMESSGLEFQFE